jgi:hypothetical protein
LDRKKGGVSAEEEGSGAQEGRRRRGRMTKGVEKSSGGGHAVDERVGSAVAKAAP